jgi:hypothetical protein
MSAFALYTSGWKDVSQSLDHSTTISTLQVVLMETTANGPAVAISVSVHEDSSWLLHVHGNLIQQHSLSMPQVPSLLDSVSTLESVLLFLSSCSICCGNCDEAYSPLIESRKGKFVDSSGIILVGIYHGKFFALHCIGSNVVAYVDGKGTIRSSKCSYLISKISARCSECAKHRRILNAMLHRVKNTQHVTQPSNSSISTNYRYLNSAEKLSRLHLLHDSLRISQSKVVYLKSKLMRLMDDRSVSVDSKLHDLSSIMEDENVHICEKYKPGTFQRVFWEQQIQASKLNSPRSMRWDPLVIRWCLYLRHLSSSAYELLKDSGIVSLPSQRTLRDYTYYTTAASGFSGMLNIADVYYELYFEMLDDVDEQLHDDNCQNKYLFRERKVHCPSNG